MNGGKHIIVDSNGSGPLTALIKGFFNLLIVCIVTAGALALFVGWLFDKKSENVVELLETVLEDSSVLKDGAPVLADFIQSRRDPDYRSQLDIDLFLDHNDARSDGTVPLIASVENKGDAVVAQLALRTRVIDENGRRVHMQRYIEIARPESHLDRHASAGVIFPGGSSTTILGYLKAPRGSETGFEIAELRTLRTYGHPGFPGHAGPTPPNPAPAPPEVNHHNILSGPGS